MGYRDELDAAHARVAALEEKVAALAASSEADAAALVRARAQLAAAEREIAALAVHLPESAARRAAPYRTLLLVALAFVLATAVAGYQSERVGVRMSYLAAATLVAALAGWLGARRSRSLGLAVAALGAIGALTALYVFYRTIWPSL